MYRKIGWKAVAAAIILAGGLAGTYYFYLAQIEKESSKLPPAGDSPGKISEDQRKAQKERLDRLLKSMDETRRLNASHPRPSITPSSDVKSTLNTLQEINRINRLNRDIRRENNRSSNVPNPPPSKP